MILTDLLPLDKWVAFENDIRERSGLFASAFDPAGIRITDNYQWPNLLCPEIKAEPRGQSFICATAHMNIANLAMQQHTPQIEECDAGLLKLVVPIFVEESFVGSIGACGLLLDEGEVDTFLINKITEIDDDRIEQLAEGIPAMSTEQANALTAYINSHLDRFVADWDKENGH